MSRNTVMGLVIAVAAGIMGFALVWHIWWLAALSLAAIILPIIVRGFETHTDDTITAEFLQKDHQQFLHDVENPHTATRIYETDPANRGLAKPERIS